MTLQVFSLFAGAPYDVCSLRAPYDHAKIPPGDTLKTNRCVDGNAGSSHDRVKSPP